MTVRSWLDDIDAISRYLARRFDPEPVSPEQLNATMEGLVRAMERFRIIKNHHIVLDPLGLVHSISSNIAVIELAMKELLTNAFKFSPDSTEIRISFHRSGNSLSILVINHVLPMQGAISGIPQSFEQKLFEPFFRLNNVNDDRYHDEMFGMGTGLTIVQGSVNQAGGQIFLYEADDFESGDNPGKRIVAEMIFPIVQD